MEMIILLIKKTVIFKYYLKVPINFFFVYSRQDIKIPYNYLTLIIIYFYISNTFTFYQEVVATFCKRTIPEAHKMKDVLSQKDLLARSK